MIERQGGDEGFAVGLERRGDPCVDLAQVGDHVAMGQHRALGHAGGAAGVLKKGDVVRLDGRVGERAPRAQGQRAIEPHGVGQTKGGNGAPDVAHRRIDQRALDAAQLIASAGDDDEFERRPVGRLLDRGGEVLENDDRLRAGIGELVFELARRIERVAVDDHIARAQRAERGDRILQQVRRHQRDAGAPRQAGDVFEVACESARFQVEFAIGNRLAHADEGGAVAKPGDAFGDEIAERAERAQVNLGRHALGIGLEPDPLHGFPYRRVLGRGSGPRPLAARQITQRT